MQRSNYKPTWGQGNRFTSIVQGAIDREHQLEVLSANLKHQEEVNKATLLSREGRTAAEIQGRKETTEITTETQKDVTGMQQTGATERVGMQQTGATERTEMQIESTEGQQDKDLQSKKDLLEKELQNRTEIAVLRETGLDSRQIKDLQNRIDLRGMDHTSAMQRLEKELDSRLDISQLKEEGMLDRLTMQLQNTYAVAELQENGSMDRLIEQLASTEGIAAADRNTRLKIIDKQIAGDKDIQKYIQSNLNKRQLKDLGHKSFMEQYIQGKLDSRLMANLESKENIQQMLIGSRKDLSLQEFNQNLQLQMNDHFNTNFIKNLDREHEFNLQQDSQKHAKKMQEDRYNRTAALGKVEHEREIVSSILKLKTGIQLSQQEKLDQTSFVASPFELHDKTGWLGFNYNEDEVLDQVGKNLPTLAQAANVLRNASKTEVGWFAKNIQGKTGLDPRVEALSSVLQGYEKELSEGQFYNALETKENQTKAASYLKDVKGLMQFLNTPSTAYEQITE